MQSLFRSRPRRRVVAGLSLGVVAAAAVVLLPAGPAPAAPGEQPVGVSIVPDSAQLDRLQRRAAEVQADLLDRQARVHAARTALAAAEAAAAEAAQVIAAADVEVARTRAEVARYASAVYRDGGDLSHLALLLSGAHPGDVVAAGGFLDAAERHAAEVVATAERQRREAVARRAEAGRTQAAARARAAELATEITGLEAAAVAATRDLEAAVAAVDEQLARQRQEVREAGMQAAAEWRRRLDELAAAGVVPPPATALRDPAAGLPAGLAPVPAADGGPQAGAAHLPRPSTPLLVLPAETIAAVSAAVDALGQPYARGAAGPDAWACGSLAQAVYGAAGIDLPGDPAGLYAVTAPVDPADALPGDLVFLEAGPSGLGHVAIAVDRGTVLAADARAGAVVVGPLPAGHVLGVGRPSLERRAAVPAPGPTGGALRVECGDPPYPPATGGRAWGGYPNGLVPVGAMCPLGVAGHLLRCDAAAAYRAMSDAFAGTFGAPLCITDSYRGYAAQVRLYGEKPDLAAVPGTSDHGWGLAVDLCGGVERFGTAEHTWMAGNAGRFGFRHPHWAGPGNGREEPWHWEYAG